MKDDKDKPCIPVGGTYIIVCDDFRTYQTFDYKGNLLKTSELPKELVKRHETTSSRHVPIR